MIGFSTSGAATARCARAFRLTGELAKPATLTVPDLRDRWEQHQAEVVFQCATSGPQRHTFTGPLLREVVAESRPVSAPGDRRDRSRLVLAVAGGYGHHTAVSWGEIDPDFGNAPVLLATTVDGRDLDQEGSQLVMPQDRCGARYVSEITGIWVGSPASARGEPRRLLTS